MCKVDFFRDDYRYGFNGQEKVDEIAGVGNHNTALFWEYDTRLGRRWNLDPVDQVKISNYACLENNPITGTDINGDQTSFDIRSRQNDVKYLKGQITEEQWYSFYKDNATAGAIGAAVLFTVFTAGEGYPVLHALVSTQIARISASAAMPAILMAINNPNNQMQIAKWGEIAAECFNPSPNPLLPYSPYSVGGAEMKNMLVMIFSKMGTTGRGSFLQGMASKLRYANWLDLDKALGKFCKTFDFWDEASKTAVVSFKTFDGQISSFKTALNKYIKVVSEAKSQLTPSGVPLFNIQNKVIDMTVTSEFLKANQKLILEYTQKAKDAGVILNITDKVH
jgi:hypothetical protein